MLHPPQLCLPRVLSMMLLPQIWQAKVSVLLLPTPLWPSRVLLMLHLPQVWLSKVLPMLPHPPESLARVLLMPPQQLWLSKVLPKLSLVYLFLLVVPLHHDQGQLRAREYGYLQVRAEVSSSLHKRPTPGAGREELPRMLLRLWQWLLLSPQPLGSWPQRGKAVCRAPDVGVPLIHPS